jgi:phosphoribosylanthranilate isomerase
MDGSMARIRVSVCANTGPADVASCVQGGVDAVGVLVGVRHVAEDAVGLDAARQILEGVPPYLGRYAVTHLTELDDLLGVVDALPIDTLQVHDQAAPETLEALRRVRPGLRLLKAIHVHPDQEPDWESYVDVVDGIVLDSIDPDADRIGGTGRVHDWSASARIVKSCPIPVILAGGLTPGNVAAAVDAVGPWAVNVNSGVESGGQKDLSRVRALVEAANSCSRSTSG